MKNKGSSQQIFKIMITEKKEERMELRDRKLKEEMGDDWDLKLQKECKD